MPLPVTPDDYKDDLVNNKRVAFRAKLDDITDVLSSVTLSDLYTNIESVIVDIPTYDLIGLDIEKEKNQLLPFAEELQQKAKNLQTDLDKRLQQVSGHLRDYEDAIDSTKTGNSSIGGRKSITRRRFSNRTGIRSHRRTSR